MPINSLSSVALSQKLKRKVPEWEAQKYINKFDKAFPTFAKYRRNILKQYKRDGFIKLPCGWYMWGDNKNDRSIQNCPIQGFGSSILRKSVELAQDKGLDICMTLHDADYDEHDSFDYNK